MVLFGVSGAVCEERLHRELGRAYPTLVVVSKAEAYNPRKGKWWKVGRQSEELIVVRRIGTT